MEISITVAAFVDVAITVLVLDHSIANDVVHQILSRGALIRIQQEFFQELEFKNSC